LAGYTEDLTQSGMRITAALKGKVVVTHGPPLPLGGLAGHALIRAAVELYAWLSSQDSLQDIMPGDAIKRGLAGFISHGYGDYQPPYDIRLRLPVSMSNPGKKTWVSGALEQLPKGVKPYGTKIEGEVVNDIIEFFNSAHAMDLSSNVSLDRSVENPASDTVNFHFITVGGSHAGRTGTILRSKGHVVTEIRLKGWRPTSDKIQELAEKIKSAKSAAKGCAVCVVYNLFDSCFYFTRCEDGSLIPPKREADGTYHVAGESILAPREMQQRTFKDLLPVLQPEDNCYKVLLAPLPRYFGGGCCSNTGHVTNLRSVANIKEAESDIYACKSSLKDMCYNSGMRGARVVSTWHLVKNIEKIWSPDNIHLSTAGYNAIAEAVLEARHSLGTRKRGGAGAGEAPPQKKPRLDHRSSADTYARYQPSPGARRPVGDQWSHQEWRYERRGGGNHARGFPYQPSHQTNQGGSNSYRGSRGGWGGGGGSGRRSWN